MGWFRKKIGQERRADSSETREYVAENVIKTVGSKGPEKGLESLENYMDREKIIIDKGASADIEHKPEQIDRKEFVQEIFYMILDEELHEVEELDEKLAETEQELDQAISDGEITSKHQAQSFFDKLGVLKDGKDGDGKYSTRRNGYRTLINLCDFLIELAETEDMEDQLPEDQVNRLKELCEERIEMIDTVNAHFGSYITETHSEDAAETIEQELRETYEKIEQEEHGFISELEARIES
jgi:hypothetical protein